MIDDKNKDGSMIDIANMRAFGHGNPEQGGSPGMTIRQYYKAAALSGFLNSTMAELLVKDRGDAAIHDLIALGCAKVADALIAEDEAHYD